MFRFFRSRRAFKCSTYLVRIKSRAREIVEVIYIEGSLALSFDGEFVGRKWEQIDICVSTNLEKLDELRVVANLAHALQEMNYEFVIYKLGTGEPIPEVDRQAVFAGLRELGFEPEISTDGSKLQLKKIVGWQPPVGFDAKAAAFRVAGLVRCVTPIRRRIELMSKSQGADANFF
jgi:hypothetical protein